jgi:hypothetical protein
MNIHRPANSNSLAAESHSHDEVGFRKAWTRAEQDEENRKRLQMMKEVAASPEWKAVIDDLKTRARVEAEKRKTVPPPRKLTDEEFDAHPERRAWVDGYDEQHDYRGYLINRDDGQ